MDRYLVISSDCHAGLPPAQYRDYLDPQYRDAFDVALPIQSEMTKAAERRFLIADINAGWRKGREEDLAGAWDSDARNRVLDGDGIAGEIVFPDGITEMNMPPFGAGISLPTETVVPELQWVGRAPTTAGSRSSARWRRSGGPGSRSCPMLLGRRRVGEGDPLGPRRTDSEGHPDPQRCLGQAARRLPPPEATTRCGRCAEELEMVVHLHSGAAPMEDYADATPG